MMKMFQEDNGNYSQMRVSAFMSVVTGCLIGLMCGIAICMGKIKEAPIIVAVTSMIVGYLSPLVPKAIQKKHEANK